MTEHTTQIPYFSVIIPTLNEEKFLPRLLKDLTEQSFHDFEVIVVDGKSEDKTVEEVHLYEKKLPIRCLTSIRRHVSCQRNMGALNAQGKVLIFFDADTQIPKNYLEKLYHIFETKRPHCCTTYLRVDSRKPSEQWFAPVTNLIFEVSRIIKTPAVYGAMQAIKRTVFEDIGGYDEETKFGEDSQLFQKAIDYNYKFYVATQPRYIFSLRRLRADGMLDTLYQYLKINLSVALNGYHYENIEYEMGGHRYEQLHRLSMVNRFDMMFKKMRKRSAQQSVSIKEFFDRLFPFSQ